MRRLKRPKYSSANVDVFVMFFLCVFLRIRMFFYATLKDHTARVFFQDTTCNTDSYHVFRTFDWHPNPGQVSSKLLLLVHVVWVQLMICVLCVCWIFFKLMLTGIVCWNMLRNTHTHTPEETHLFQFRCRGHLFSHSNWIW